MPLAYEPTAASPSRGRLPAWVRAFFMDRLTPSGRALVAIGTVVTALSTLTLAIKVYFLFSVLAGLALLSIPLARLARAPLEVRLFLPDRATCGGHLEAQLRVRHRGSRPAVDLALRLDGLPPTLEARPLDLGSLAPGAELDLVIPIALTRRGYYQLQGVVQETWFPFNVWRDVVRHRLPQTLLVYPRFEPLAQLNLPVGRKYQPGGIALSSNVGDSTEFLGVREFRPGDPIKNIHWKSWGRVGKPVVKEFQEEFFCKIAMVLDTFVPPDSGETYREDFEASLSMAAAVADKLSHSEYIVDLFAAGPDLYTLQAGRNLAHLDNVLDVLACLEPSREEPFERVAPVLMDHLATITTVVLILLDWDAARERLVRIIRDHGPAVRVVLVRRTPASLSPSGAEDLAGPLLILTPDDVAKGVESL